MAEIQIIVGGIDKLSADYKKFIFDIKNNMIVPLDDSAAKYLKVISANFSSQGQIFGEVWPPLSPATIRDKQRLMKQGKALSAVQPLVRTGKLKGGFGRAVSGLHKAYVYNTQKYVILHNEGGSAVYNGRTVVIPKRVLATVDDARVAMVAKVFAEWVSKIVFKHTL